MEEFKVDLTVPCDLAAERAILGCALGHGQKALDAVGAFETAEFFLPAHCNAWEAIRATEAKRVNVDIVSVGAEVRAAGSWHRFPEGWHDWAVGVSAASPPMATLPEAVRIVHEAYVLRRLIKLGTDIVASAKSGSGCDDVMELARKGIAELEITGSGGPVSIGEAMPGVLATIEEKMTTEKLHAVPFGISNVDYVVGGACPGNLIVVAARPGIGKTAFIDVVVESCGLASIPFAMFSVEMTKQEWIERMLSLRSDIAANVLRFPKGDARKGGEGGLTPDLWRKLQTSAGEVAAWPLHVDDRPLKIGQIVGEARRWHAREVVAKGYTLGAVAIDYAQIVGVDSAKGENRERQVARISSDSKILAKAIGCPVFLVSQINRSAAKEDRRPRIDDLRESGAIEQDADVIILLHRDLNPDEEGAANKDGPAEAIIGKNRFGKTGIADLYWKGSTMRYAALDKFSDDQQPSQPARPNYQDNDR